MIQTTTGPVPGSTNGGPTEQDLVIYWDDRFARVLETWGLGKAWTEIQVLVAGRRGKLLDLACGTGRTWDFLKHNPGLEYHGLDIVPPLIERAVQRGID